MIIIMILMIPKRIDRRYLLYIHMNLCLTALDEFPVYSMQIHYKWRMRIGESSSFVIYCFDYPIS
jgi:hypothetical protein